MPPHACRLARSPFSSRDQVASRRKEFFEGLLHPLADADEEELMIDGLEGLNVGGKNFLQELRNMSQLPPITDGYDESSLVQSFFAN
jgi:hypothetical protein